MSTRRYSYAHKRAHWSSYANDQARRGRQGHGYRKWKAQVLAPDVLVCRRCGYLIDKSLPWRDPWAKTAGHIIPVTMAPHLALDPANGAPEHRRCNLSAGNAMAPIKAQLQCVADRQW